MYVKAYSEYMAYLRIFRIVDIFTTVFRYYSRAIYAYSELYLGRFRHI